MSKHQFRNQSFGLNARPVNLYCVFTVGAAGAPTLDTTRSKGIKSIVRNSVGDYTITLDDSYVRLLTVGIINQNAAGIPVHNVYGIKTAGTNVNTTGAGTIEIVYSAATSATNTALIPADPANGDTSYVTINLDDSNL